MTSERRTAYVRQRAGLCIRPSRELPNAEPLLTDSCGAADSAEPRTSERPNHSRSGRAGLPARPSGAPAALRGAGSRLRLPRGLAGSPRGGVQRSGGGAWRVCSAGGGLRPPARLRPLRPGGGASARPRRRRVRRVGDRCVPWPLQEDAGGGGGERLLMPEEARLLAEIGAVTLVSAPRPDPRQHSLTLASFKRQQEQGFQEQSALAAEARETRRQELREKIAEGQAAKKQRLEQDSGAGESQEASGNPAAGENEASASQASGEQEEAGSSSPQPGPSDGVAPLPRSALLVQLATARPRPIKARPLDWRVQSKDWPHAGRPAHELRYSIYRDLWERGFFLSAAGKFGGDFLVYPGDPLRFHAHYIAQCWAPGDPIPLQDLVSAGRLGTSVRKTLLLCSPQPDGKVVYTSLQWASLQ
nr:PREDICTED: tRNA-splicing endonuclease subunit Sen34 [Equus przewalskii]